ncbi:hypothetical protein [Nakamurella leprariae]|uniref:Uncharacterized protein n=1 Tax=Nakamurella leprariae TaxID=2803911 RepID=A0A939C2D9_9ACTN|nr:hypothetical protein [Nakamurella leprariae]MBM9468144.1 hypothetical protein [Nakamurella leprariae]
MDRTALWLHDDGSQFGLEPAMRHPGRRHPERIAALIVQSGDIHQDEYRPEDAALEEHWADPSPQVAPLVRDFLGRVHA